MTMKKLIYIIHLFVFTSTYAQKVGIGTINPDSRLTIRAEENQNILSFKNFAGTTKWHWSIPSGSSLMLSESGIADNRLIITQGGNVGISTGNPQYRLHVNGSGYFSSSMTTLDGYCTNSLGIGAVNASLRLNVYDALTNRNIAKFHNAGGYGQILVSNATITSDLGADLSKGYVGTNSNHDFIIRSGGDDAIMIKHGTRNVGIGTNTPAVKLHVNGNTRIDGTLQVTQQPALNSVTFYSSDFSNWGSPYENVTYYKDAEGRVHLSGVVKITGSQVGAMFVLPAGYRPAGDLPFVCMTQIGDAHRVNVNSTGHVTISLPAVSGWISVSGISFRAQ